MKATLTEQREEQLLLERLRAGDARAFERLVRENAGRLLVVARNMLRDDDEAEDAVQETFLRAHRALSEFKGDSRLSTWLHRICVNSCLMKLRTRRRKPFVTMEALTPRSQEGERTNEFVEGHERSPSSDLIDAETRAIVRECIDQLPPTLKTVIVLRDIEQRDTQESAKILGISLGATKTRLHRARRALRELLVEALGKNPIDHLEDAGRIWPNRAAPRGSFSASAA